MAAVETKAFETKFQAALNAGINTLSDDDYKLIKGNSWSLSSKYQDILTAYNTAATAITNLIAKYKEMADITVDESVGAVGAVGSVGAAVGAAVGAEVGTNKTLIIHLVKYTIKKRAALVYMCLLYIQKLKESEGKKAEELAKINDIITKVQELRKGITENLYDVSNATEKGAKNAANAANAAANKTAANAKTDKLDAINVYITAVQAELTALAEKKKKELEDKDNLLKDIIPFISKQSELGEFKQETISPAKQ